MAKTKYQKMVSLLEDMLSNISTSILQVEECAKNFEILVIANGEEKNGNILESKAFNRENNFFKHLLYCPSKKEMSNSIDWYEEEDEGDSLTYIMETIFAENQRQSIINQNLLKDPMPVYELSLKKWLSGIETEGQGIPKNPKLDLIQFRPERGQIIIHAYDRLQRSIFFGVSNHHKELRDIYKADLENSIFEGTCSCKTFQKNFLNRWKNRLFNKDVIFKKPAPGRWKESECIDRYTAGDIILKLIQSFIDSPQKKELAETVCIIWILIWISKEAPEYPLSLKEILSLKCDCVSDDSPEIKLELMSFEISSGLHELLMYLKGEGGKKKNGTLFKNMSIKRMERVLHRVSIELNITPHVQPSTFYTFPHIYVDQRIEVSTIKNQRAVSKLVPSRAATTRRSIHKFILKSTKSSDPNS